MKKTFTLLLLLCFCGIAGAQTKVILSEDFSKFIAGTEEAPDTVAINSNDDYFQSPGWRWGGVTSVKRVE